MRPSVVNGLLLAAHAVTAAPTSTKTSNSTIISTSDPTSGYLAHPLVQIASSGADTKLLAPVQSTTYNWAGAALSGTGFNYVTGTFIVPSISMPRGGDPDTSYSVAIWLGIDGIECDSIFQVGLVANILNYEVTYIPVFEWLPGAARAWTGMTIRPGDQVTLSIEADSPTSGTATFENLSQLQIATASFQNQPASVALCQRTAEWIVEDYTVNEVLVPLADFDTVSWTDGYAIQTSTTATSAGSTSPSSDNDSVILLNMASETTKQVEAVTSVQDGEVRVVYYDP